MSLSPLLPAWIIVVAAVVAGILLWQQYRRPSVPAALRVFALLTVFILIANPVRFKQAETEAAPRLAVILDHSASMAAKDDSDQTRLQRSTAALDQFIGGLRQRYHIDTYRLDHTVQAGEWAKDATALADVTQGTSFTDLSNLTAADPAPSAIVLVSDGRDRGNEHPETTLQAAQIPVFTALVGSGTLSSNIAVALRTTGPTAFPGQDVSLIARVDASIDLHGRPTEIILHDRSGRELERRSITLGQDTELRFSQGVGETAGERLWTITVAAVDGEVSTADNEAAVAIQIVDQALNLVVIEGQPYWDTSFAVRAWRSDQQLSVQSVYRVGNRRYRSGDKQSQPSLKELLTSTGLQDIDLVVLGIAVDKLIDAQGQQALVDFVDQGGGMLLIGRRENFAGSLAHLDPLIRRRGGRDNIKPVLTAAGRLAALLPVDSRMGAVTSGLIDGIRPRTQILLGNDRQPLVASRRLGAGQVTAINAEGIWRWSLGMNSDRGVAARFWQQVAKNAVRQQQSALRPDRPRYTSGQQATISCSADAPIRCQSPTGTISELTVSQGSTSLDLDEAGVWHLQQGTNTLSLIADADVRELVDAAHDPARMVRLARATGGAAVALADIDELASRLSGRADLQMASGERLPILPLGLGLGIIFILLAAEWWLRRRRHGAL